MYSQTTQRFVELADQKLSYKKLQPLAFLVQSAMAGAYVGFGVILIFSVGGGVAPELQKLVMGVSFGVALTLIVFAGAELFTGHTMYSSFALLRKRHCVADVARLWIFVWLGNFLGALLLVAIYTLGRGAVLNGEASELLLTVAIYKIYSPADALFARGILCNWLVCLAIWMAVRTDSDSAKAIVIFWALFAFIASGYEHSIANMTLLTLALVADSNSVITISGVLHNLVWVTCGNIVGGALFMGLAYHLGTQSELPSVGGGGLGKGESNANE